MRRVFVSSRDSETANSRPPLENYSNLCTTAICYGINVDLVAVPFFRTLNGLRAARRPELAVFLRKEFPVSLDVKTLNPSCSTGKKNF